MKFHRDERGQALIESSIGMGLAVFTLILVFMSTYLTVNRNRTMTAARHAAWLAGNDRRDNDVDHNGFGRELYYLNNINLWNWFFSPGTDLHTEPVYYSKPENPGNLLIRVEKTGGGNLDLSLAHKEVDGSNQSVSSELLTQSAVNIDAYRIQFGFGDRGSMRASSLSKKWPWPLYTVNVPFTGETFMDAWLLVEARAKWDEVADPWKEKDTAFYKIEPKLLQILSL